VTKGIILNHFINNVAKCITALGIGAMLSAALAVPAHAATKKATKPAAQTAKAGKTGPQASKQAKASVKAPANAKVALKATDKFNAKASSKTSSKLLAQAAPSAKALAKMGKAERLALAREAAKPGKSGMLKASVRLASPAGKPVMQKVVVRGKNGKRMVVLRPVREPRAERPVMLVSVPAPAPRQSYGQLAGLHSTQDELELKSSVALVVDQDTQEVLFSKNDAAVLPIASITKLMTGVVVSEAGLDMSELLTITQDDVDTEKGSRSRLSVGAQLTRGELMLLALMSSENRAAHALGRTYPGGLQRFVQLMNGKASQLGMKSTRYVEPTGLSSNNQSSAQDLATLVNYASNNPLLRELSTSPDSQVAVGEKTLNYVNTNRLTRNPEWDIGLQKTGYISEAGQCLVMQAKIAGRKLIMVFLDSAGKLSRLGDAERVRKWVENNRAPVVTPVSAAARTPQG
jgi:serine-type D-Ala-D-Ala endopeptidase (penicillin-binding protein 7)